MMTKQEIERELKGHNFLWVRIFQGGSQPHAHTGMLYRVEGEFGIVKPTLHRELESIPLSRLALWRSRNQQSEQMRMTRATRNSQS